MSDLPPEQPQLVEEIKRLLNSFIRNLQPETFNGNWRIRRLSSVIRRRIISLACCDLADENALTNVYEPIRDLAESIVTELILFHQDQDQLCSRLWMALRERNCLFMGPDLQDEVLQIIASVMEDGTPMARIHMEGFTSAHLRYLYPFVNDESVKRIVQLLIMASCFRVSQGEEGEVLELRSGFRDHASLRREHDIYIVQVAFNSGMRIYRDQWSILLHGDFSQIMQMEAILGQFDRTRSMETAVHELQMALDRQRNLPVFGRITLNLPALLVLDRIHEGTERMTWNTLQSLMNALNELVNTLHHPPEMPLVMSQEICADADDLLVLLALQLSEQRSDYIFDSAFKEKRKKLNTDGHKKNTVVSIEPEKFTHGCLKAFRRMRTVVPRCLHPWSASHVCTVIEHRQAQSRQQNREEMQQQRSQQQPEQSHEQPEHQEHIPVPIRPGVSATAVSPKEVEEPNVVEPNVVEPNGVALEVLAPEVNIPETGRIVEEGPLMMNPDVVVPDLAILNVMAPEMVANNDNGEELIFSHQNNDDINMAMEMVDNEGEMPNNHGEVVFIPPDYIQGEFNMYDQDAFDQAGYDQEYDEFDQVDFDQAEFDQAEFDQVDFDQAELDQAEIDQDEIDQDEFDQDEFDQPELDQADFDPNVLLDEYNQADYDQDEMVNDEDEFMNHQDEMVNYDDALLPVGPIVFPYFNFVANQQYQARVLERVHNQYEQIFMLPEPQQQEPGASCDNQGPGASCENQEPGASCENQEPDVSYENQEPGASCENQEPGASCENQEPGASCENQERGVFCVNQEPGASCENQENNVFNFGAMAGALAEVAGVFPPVPVIYHVQVVATVHTEIAAVPVLNQPDAAVQGGQVAANGEGLYEEQGEELASSNAEGATDDGGDAEQTASGGEAPT